ncbi:MAG: AsmA family protein [Kiritimatiellales bacterium]|nr:AsmA family protein [Kiritimatiellota bacterium]MBL7011733.1 AsmA family protein [Kiritimatiellales bacterium]
MKKILLIVGIVILILIVVVVLFLGQIIKAGIETAGPKIAGVPMSVEKVRVNPLTGNVHVKALIIGNPEGFKTDSLMELGEFNLDIALGSLFTDTIMIKQILIDAPEITYEKGLRSSNISTLMDNLAPAEQPEEKVTEEPKKKKAPAKKVVIEDFQLNNAKVNVTLTALGGKKMTLPLPSIQMQDIGKGTGGTDIREVISEVFGSISDAVVKALASSGDFAGDALKGAGGAVKDVGGAATDSMKDVGGAATDAAKSTTDALKKGIGGLFGKE